MTRIFAPIAAALVLAGCAALDTPPPPAQPEAPPAMAVASWPPPRPLPEPVTPPPEFLAAIERGTRTASGRPGHAYWQQWADYSLRARLLPEEKRLLGSAAITYHNRSPHALSVLALELAQNFHAAGERRLETAEITGGIELARVAVDGVEIARTDGLGPDGAPGYVVDGTHMVLRPPASVQPGSSSRIEVDWELTVPRAGIGARMGWDGDDLVFIAYWYPRMLVFDDVIGWQADQFLGTAEFYHGFGSYDLTIEAPAGWLVQSTGALLNAEEVLAPDVVERMRAAHRSDSVVRVVGPADFERATLPGRGGTLTWRFAADSVRDVAFSATRRSIWDATRSPVGDRTGDGQVDHAAINALYREGAPLWAETARYSRHAIDFLSRFTGFPYPWPHMTAVEGGGIIGGGMEFPMMTLMGDYNARGDSALYYVTAHELAHMWIPMIISTDERRYSWIDEGSTTFAENRSRTEFFPGPDHDEPDRAAYLRLARAGAEGEMTRRSDFHYASAPYVIASYYKPATVLRALMELLGEETFMAAYRELYDRWAYRHMYPWDMWNTFEDVSGRELGWFWDAFYRRTWVLDQAVAEVRRSDDGWRITVEDRGRVPMPARLLITRADGTTLRREIPVEVWLGGATSAQVTVPPGAALTRVEIDPSGAFPDVDRDNNVWEAGG